MNNETIHNISFFDEENQATLGEHWKVGEIYATNDLNFFTLHPSNRKISNAHVRRIKKSIEENGLLDPIKVSSRGVVYNGQHRIIALKELHNEGKIIPVKFVFVEEQDDIKAIISLNAVQKELTMSDYIELYAQGGHPQYKLIVELANKHKITTSAVVSIAFTGGNNSFFTQLVKQGNDLPFEDWDVVDDYLSWIKDLSQCWHQTLKSKQMLFKLFQYPLFDPDIMKEKMLKEYQYTGEKLRFSIRQNNCKKQLIDLYNKGSHRTSKNYIAYMLTADGKIILPEM